MAQRPKLVAIPPRPVVENPLPALIRSSLSALMPPPELSPSEWAERNVRIPVGNALPGLIRFDNAPYQREPLDMMANPDCNRVSLMWGAQVGKTLVVLCGQGYRIAHDPTSQMMMQPSQGDLQTWLETKFNPMVDANPALSDKIAKPRGREGVNNQLMKSYPGGFIMFAWSGSPKTMRGRSAPFIAADEVDGYDRTDEGHPVSLLSERAKTFGDLRKIIETSTPTRKGASYIEKAFDAGDQRYFMVPCPHCGHLQRLVWGQVTWLKDDEGAAKPESAGYACEQCGVVWTNLERVRAIRTAVANGGGWKASKPFRGHASYHLSELYSLLTSLAQIVQSFLDKKAAGDLQTFVNVSLAETWEEQGDQADAGSMMARAEFFPPYVPAGVGVITAGVDMQEDRLEVELVGWGLGEESWSLAHHVIWGDPTQPEVWEDLKDLLDQPLMHASGETMRIYAVAVDTGGNGGMTQGAYDWLAKQGGRRIFGIKGVPGWGKPVVEAPSRRRSGKRQRKIDLFKVGVDEGKLIVTRRFQIDQAGPGYCHFPKDRDPEWFAQATAETLRRRYVRGFPVLEWMQTRPRNEAFDCRVYAYAALKILNPNIARLLARYSEDDDPPTASDPKTPEASKPAARQSAPKRRQAIASRR